MKKFILLALVGMASTFSFANGQLQCKQIKKPKNTKYSYHSSEYYKCSYSNDSLNEAYQTIKQKLEKQESVGSGVAAVEEILPKSLPTKNHGKELDYTVYKIKWEGKNTFHLDYAVEASEHRLTFKKVGKNIEINWVKWSSV